jgi:predicted membrane chloride channel (bestrophin family)
MNFGTERPPAPLPSSASPREVFLHYAAHRRASYRVISGRYHGCKNATKSTDGFFHTILFIGYYGHCMDYVIHAWVAATLYSALFSILNGYNLISADLSALPSNSFFAVTTTLSLLLAFRANRAAVRYWDARAFWGVVVADVRILGNRIVSNSLLAPENEPLREDSAIFLCRLVAFAVTTRNYLRRQRPLLFPDDYIGLSLTQSELQRLDNANHICNENMQLLWRSLRTTFPVPSGCGVQSALAHESAIRLLDDLVLRSGGLERIRNSPLPVIWTYVRERGERKRVRVRAERTSARA